MSKKTIVVTLFLLLYVNICCVYAADENGASEKMYFGDCNMDGVINLQDANVCLKMALGFQKPRENQVIYCDSAMDGITLSDANEILRIAVGIREKYSISEKEYQVLYEGIAENRVIKEQWYIPSYHALEKLYSEIEEEKWLEEENVLEPYLQYMPSEIFDTSAVVFIMYPVYTDDVDEISILQMNYRDNRHQPIIKQELLGKNQKGNTYVAILTVEKEPELSCDDAERTVWSLMQYHSAEMYKIKDAKYVMAVGDVETKIEKIISADELQNYKDKLAEHLLQESKSELEYYIQVGELNYEEIMEQAKENARIHIEESLGTMGQYDDEFFEKNTLYLYQRSENPGAPNYILLDVSDDTKQIILKNQRIRNEENPPEAANWLTWLIKKLMGKKSMDSKETNWAVTEITMSKEFSEQYELVLP